MKLYISIVNIISIIAIKVPNKIKSILLSITCFLIPFQYVVHSMNDSRYYILRIIKLPDIFFNQHLSLCVLLAVLLFLSIKEKVDSIHYNRTLFIIYLLYPISILINSLFYKTAESTLYFAFELLVLFPCLYIVWNDRKDYEQLIKKVSIGFSFTFLILYLLCFKFAENGKLLYLYGYFAAFIYNTNVLGFIAMTSSISCIYLLYSNKTNYVFTIYSTLVFVMSNSFIVLSGCRSALLVVLISIIIYLVFIIKSISHSNIRNIIKHITIVISLTFIFTFVINKANDYMIKLNNSSCYIEVEIPEVDEQIKVTEAKLSTKNKTIRQYFSSRIDIWEAYYKEISLTGHNNTELPFKDESHAHNSFIQISYLYGITVGIINFILFVIACIKSIKTLFSNRSTNLDFYTVMITASFAVQSLIEIITELHNQGLAFCFYIVSLAFVFKDTSTTIDSKEDD